VVSEIMALEIQSNKAHELQTTYMIKVIPPFISKVVVIKMEEEEEENKEEIEKNYINESKNPRPNSSEQQKTKSASSIKICKKNQQVNQQMKP
jgi:hypothetical protein